MTEVPQAPPLSRSPRSRVSRVLVGSAGLLLALHVLALVAVPFGGLTGVLVLVVLAPVDVAALAVAASRAGPRGDRRTLGPAGVVRVAAGLAGGLWAGVAVLVGSGWAFVAVPAGAAALVIAAFPRSAEAWRWCLRVAAAAVLAAVTVAVTGWWLSRDALEPYGLVIGVALGALLLAVAVALAAAGWLLATLSGRGRSTPGGAAPRPR